MRKLIVASAISATLVSMGCSRNIQEETVAPISKQVVNEPAIIVTRDNYQSAVNPDSTKISMPKYKANVPASIMTPDNVQTKNLGELNFVDGFPTDETVTKTYDFLDTSRAVELFLNATPTTSMYAMLNGHSEIGFKANRTVGITETLMNARSLWLTPQTTTPYVHAEVDVKNGPVVFEIGSPR